MNMFTEALQGGGSANTTVSRRKIWEIETMLRCPVVGVCLSMREQRQLCRKVGAPEHAKSDFAVHELIVATMTGENPLSSKLDRLLERKFGRDAQGWLALPEQEFLTVWRDGLDHCEYQALLWAAAVRRLSGTATVEIFGSLHMAMHEQVRAFGRLTGARRAAEVRAEQLRERNRELERQVRSLSGLRAELETSLAQCRCTPESAPERSVQPPVDLVAELDALRVRLACVEQEAAERERLLSGLQAEHGRLEEDYLQLREEYAAHLSLDAAMRQACAGEACVGDSCAGCTPECPSYSLCEKRVLIVGGIERMEKAYRKFIEERGGIFEYHAGHMKARKALENSVQRADVVLCPVNCNSHGACLMVKSLGKKYRKPVHMLNNFSLSTLARTVDGLHGRI